MLIDKCSCSIHFQLASAHCAIQLFLSYAFFPFVNKKIFMRLQRSVWDKEEKTKLNQTLINIRGRIYYTWKKAWVQMMRKYKEMTITNWGALCYRFMASGKNYKMAQSFRVPFDQKRKNNLKLQEDKILKLIISCCLILCFFFL